MSILLITIDPGSAVAQMLKMHYDTTVISPALAKQCTSWTVYQYIVTYRCPWIVPKSLLAEWEQAGIQAMNIHPSLLPKYAGLNPWQEMFSCEERTGGVTIHRLSEVVDAGEIIMQQSMPILSNDSIGAARNRADKLAAKMIQTVISKYAIE
ncbi:MAG TPA: hypothetical protein DIW30_05640 [Bacteroidales bacterium]|nr:hypothetical protein [Bacteroidales bacterium]